MTVHSQSTKSRHKTHQISIRLPEEMDAWLEKRVGSQRTKAEFVRQLLERERAREREQELLDMFNAAAAEVDDEERNEREFLLGARTSQG